MHFKFVEIIDGNEYNESALVLLNQKRKITHVARQGDLFPVPNYDFGQRQSRYAGTTIRRVFDSLYFTEQYNRWEIYETSSLVNHQFVDEDPIRELSEENESGLTIKVADIKTTAKFLWRSNHEYGSKEPVRNKSALIVINSENAICFIAQSLKFNYVLPSEVIINKIYESRADCNIMDGKEFEFDSKFVWEKI